VSMLLCSFNCFCVLFADQVGEHVVVLQVPSKNARRRRPPAPRRCTHGNLSGHALGSASFAGGFNCAEVLMFGFLALQAMRQMMWYARTHLPALMFRVS